MGAVRADTGGTLLP